MEQRELKFRAWDKDMREMLRVKTIQFEPNAPYQNPCIFDQNNDIRDLEDIILMQFTGLKDKNGKEIYEGDIILQKDVVYTKSEFTPDGIQETWEDKNVEIIFKDGIFGFIHPMTDDIESLGNYPDNEIIGNIFENPELLNY
jgi:uncharacterized phage protein (TIGR01671 family)